MAAPLPQGSSLSALPVAPTVDPSMFARDDALRRQQVTDQGLTLGAKFARLYQLKDTLALEDARRKADVANAKLKEQEAEALQRRLVEETKAAILKAKADAETQRNVLAAQGALATLGVPGAQAQAASNAAQVEVARSGARLAGLTGTSGSPSLVAKAQQAEEEMAGTWRPDPSKPDNPLAATHSYADWSAKRLQEEMLQSENPVMSPYAIGQKLGVKVVPHQFRASDGSEWEVPYLTGPTGERFRQTGPAKLKNVSEAQQVTDKATAGRVSEFASGGEQRQIDDIAKLDSAIKVLEDPKTTLASGRVIGNAPDFVLALFQSPKTRGAIKDIQSVVTQNLKKILGSQFTEREAKQFMERAFDPRLSEEQNAKRIRVLRNELQNVLSAEREAVEYFRTHNTLLGFVPPAQPSSLRQPEAGPTIKTPAAETKPGEIRMLRTPITLSDGRVLPAGTPLQKNVAGKWIPVQ
jgi:hypothetical protein